MSLISAALGLDKSASEKKAQKAQASVGSTVASLIPGVAANYQAADKLYGGTLPTLGAAFGDLSKTTTQAGRDGLVSDFGARQTARANDVAAQAGHAFNLTPDMARGYALDAHNQANAATAQYQQTVNSPAEKIKALLALIQAGGALRPDASGLTSLSSVVW